MVNCGDNMTKDEGGAHGARWLSIGSIVCLYLLEGVQQLATLNLDMPAYRPNTKYQIIEQIKQIPNRTCM
jgi:hypothetical protein